MIRYLEYFLHYEGENCMIGRAPYSDGVFHSVKRSTTLLLLKNRGWNISQHTEGHFGDVLYIFL